MDPSSTPPKLSLYWLPNQRPEPPGMVTPPPGLPVSVPFLWEEAPGKPRKQPTLGAGAIRSLDLPPRLVAAAEIKFDKTLSPITVLDGPDRSSQAMPLGSCYSFSFGEGRTVVNMGGRKKEGVAWFWRRGSARKVTREGDSWEMGLEGLTKKGVACSPVPSSSSSSFYSSSKLGGDCEAEVVEEGKVRITRLRRNRSIASASTSHLWGSIYGSLKKVLPMAGRRDRKV